MKKHYNHEGHEAHKEINYFFLRVLRAFFVFSVVK
jgi:hypothetical protein